MKVAFDPNKPNEFQIKTFGGFLGRKNISFQSLNGKIIIGSCQVMSHGEDLTWCIAQCKAELKVGGESVT